MLSEMTSGMNGLRWKHGEVSRMKILLVLVDVMHDFVWRERPSEHGFGYDAMLMPCAVFRI